MTNASDCCVVEKLAFGRGWSVRSSDANGRLWLASFAYEEHAVEYAIKMDHAPTPAKSMASNSDVDATPMDRIDIRTSQMTQRLNQIRGDVARVEDKVNAILDRLNKT
jgi:hypothetical protein